MEERLRPLNGLLGLVRADGLYPSPLGDAGFRLAGLEVPAVTPTGNVVVDALLHHVPSNLLLACEVKSGANVEHRQALNYAGLNAAGLVRTASLTIAGGARPSVLVLYVCLREHVERIRLGLDEAAVRFPVLAIDEDAVTLHPVESVPDVLQSLSSVAPVVVPVPSVIPFDQDSEVEVIRPVVAAELVAALAHRRPQVGLSWLTEQVAPHASLYGRQARQRLLKSVEEAARGVAAEQPASFHFVPAYRNDEARVSILKTPEDLDPRGRTQAYQALARSGPRPRRSPRTSPRGQMDLLQVVQPSDDEDDSSSEPAEEGET